MKKRINREALKKGIYSAAALALCVTALFAFWMSNRNNNAPVETPEESESVSQSITTRPQTEEPSEESTAALYDSEEVEQAAAQKTAYFALPLENGIIKEFSKGELVKNATTGDWRTHTGADYKGVEGDPVKAIYNGTVTEVTEDALWGTVVTVDHTSGIIAEYRGLQKGSVPEPGTEIKINDKIGTLGEIPIEKADGAHLHLEIYKNGTAVSPADYAGKNVKLG